MKPLLKIGSNEAAVFDLKDILRKQGMWTGSTSKVFGIATEQAVKYFQSTHVGPDGTALKTDGVVGDKTWWALVHPSGVAQKSLVQPVPTKSDDSTGLNDDFQRRYGLFSKERQAFIRAAFNEHARGVKESPDGSNTGTRINLYTKGYGAVAWCALFISWLFFQVMGRYPNNANQPHVKTGWNLAKTKHRTYGKDKVPTPGDLLIWDFGGGNGHVSMCVAVSPDGKKVNTIGGNESNTVKLGLRTIANESSLVGYIDLIGEAKKPNNFLRLLLPTGASLSNLDVSSSR